MIRFRNRKDAAQQLAAALNKYIEQDVLVVGIPRGGVETAYYVARHLKAELSIVVTRKLGYPSNPEAAFGAIAEDGSIYLSEEARSILSEDQINAVVEEQKEEIKRRLRKLRNSKPLPKMKNRTVIIVDDGIATGATLFATIALCKRQQAGKIVVAAPIAGENMIDILRNMVNDVIILHTPSFYRAVSQGYTEFNNLTDEEAVHFLELWEKEAPLPLKNTRTI